MIPIIAFVGEKKNGKTFIIKKVIDLLVERGRRVSVLKHTGHGFRLDYPETDSYQLIQAGAKMVALVGDGKIGLYGDAGFEPDPEGVRDLFFPAFDIILVEGYKSSHLPKIVVAIKGNLPEWTNGLNGLVAVVSEAKPDFDVKHFHPEQINEITDLIESYIHIHRKKREVKIYLDGKNLQIKPFIKDFFLNTITAMVSSLKGAEGARRIQITIDLPEGVSVPVARMD
jgi:molybdopterin-guanine dinucleotide biosynthesis protein B